MCICTPVFQHFFTCAMPVAYLSLRYPEPPTTASQSTRSIANGCKTEITGGNVLLLRRPNTPFSLLRRNSVQPKNITRMLCDKLISEQTIILPVHAHQCLCMLTNACTSVYSWVAPAHQKCLPFQLFKAYLTLTSLTLKCITGTRP